MQIISIYGSTLWDPCSMVKGRDYFKRGAGSCKLCTRTHDQLLEREIFKDSQLVDMFPVSCKCLERFYSWTWFHNQHYPCFSTTFIYQHSINIQPIWDKNLKFIDVLARWRFQTYSNWRNHVYSWFLQLEKSGINHKII